MTVRLFLFVSLLVVGCERDVLLPEGLAWDRATATAFTAQPRLAVTNNGDDTLSFVSVDSLTAPRVLGQAFVGNSPIDPEGPHHLVPSPDGRFLYYNLSNYVLNGGGGPHGAHGAGSVPGFLVKLDARTNRPLGQALIDRSPGDVIVSRDGRLVYVSHYDLARLMQQLTRGGAPEDGYSTVALVDAEHMQVLSQTPVCPTAHGMGLSPAGTELYVTCSQSDELAVLDVRDPARPRVALKLPVGPAPGMVGAPRYAPYALAVHPGDGTVWLSNNQSSDVRVFDPARMQMVDARAVRVGGVAMFADFSPDLATLYVPHQGDERVTAIELASGRTRDLDLPKAACLNAHALQVLPGGGGAAIVCEGDHRERRGSIVFIDLAAWAVAGHVEVGLFPDAIKYMPGL